MNKQFKYKGYSFNIKVEMNVTSIAHRVTVNDMGASNYSIQATVIEKEAIQAIKEMTETAKTWADKRANGQMTDFEKDLVAMHFK